MITIGSREYNWIADDRSLERGQIFSIRVPDKDVIELDFDRQELDLIKRANEGDESPKLLLNILLMIVDKIEKSRESLENENAKKIENSFDPDDISRMFVDHLTTNLEKGSIFEIIVFLSRYCGWDRIKKYMDDHIHKLEEGLKNG